MDTETQRDRVIAVAEYWDDHPYLTRGEVERALGMTRDVPDSGEMFSQKRLEQLQGRLLHVEAQLAKHLEYRRQKGEY